MNDFNLNNDSILDQNLDATELVKRSKFLSVLCILSFIGNGIGIFQGLILWSMTGIFAKIFTGITQNLNNVPNIFNYISWAALIFIISSITCLAGALLMWKLKKIGFFLYLLGEVAPTITIFLFFASLDFPGSTMVGLTNSLTMSIFPIAFIVMYSINYKHLS
jgi:hypothetical protein